MKKLSDKQTIELLMWCKGQIYLTFSLYELYWEILGIRYLPFYRKKKKEK